MEMLKGSGRPIYACTTKDMEEDYYGEEAILPRQNALIQLLRQRERRLTQMTWFLAVVLVVVVSAAALLVGLLLGQRAEPADKQLLKNPERYSFDSSNEHPKEMEDNPSAMLSVPVHIDPKLPYLDWDSKLGITVHISGGFNYSNGNLVVPREGKYRIYLQITYEDDSGRCVRDEMILRNSVYVFMDSYQKKVLLLSSYDTVKCDMNTWSKSLYTAGSIKLEANSKLSVTSSHPEFISKNHVSTFFGAEFQTVHVSVT
ncbi:Hypothetical predicted protein [Scomber scombrus]|uniref:THD domain-containing protein n=1 Tax=Scomber scombrus TaxID=13677 RepID=A0AAV1NKG5_SCOSC